MLNAANATGPNDVPDHGTTIETKFSSVTVTLLPLIQVCIDNNPARDWPAGAGAGGVGAATGGAVVKAKVGAGVVKAKVGAGVVKAEVGAGVPIITPF